MLLTAGAVMTMLPTHAPADTVRSRASDYFDRIKWTRNYESVQPSALPGYALPGNEAYASLVLSSTSTWGFIPVLKVLEHFSTTDRFRPPCLVE